MNVRDEDEFTPVNARPAKVEIITGVGKSSQSYNAPYDESTTGNIQN